METNKRPWEIANKGKAQAAFSADPSPSIQQPSKGSEMVKATKSGLHEGPKPPGHLYHAAKKQEFNKNWREEYRQSLAEQKSQIEEYKKAKAMGLKVEFRVEVVRVKSQGMSL